MLSLVVLLNIFEIMLFLLFNLGSCLLKLVFVGDKESVFIKDYVLNAHTHNLYPLLAALINEFGVIG